MASQVKRVEREILTEFDSQFKEVRNRLNDQLKCLDSRQESQQKLLEDFQDYCKQRAEAEQEYSKRCEKIFDTFTRRTSTHRVQRDWAGEAGVPSPVQCWTVLLDNLRSQSKQHQHLGMMYSDNFAKNFAFIREGLEKVHNKSREMTITVHDDLIRQLNELYSAIKSYHNSHRDSKEAEAKKTQIEAERQRLEDKNKKIDKKLERQLDKALEKFGNAELKATKARNDYITILGTVNASLQKYFEKDLTNIIDCLDLGYIRLLKRNLQAQQTAEQQVLEMKTKELQNMEMKTRCMNANTDKELFVEAHHNAFTLPEIFDFHPHYGDRTHEMEALPFLADMEDSYVRLSTATQKLQLEVDEIKKSLREVDRGWEDDENSNPIADEIMEHFKKLRQMVNSPSVSGLNRVPSMRGRGKNLQQDTEFYYLAKYSEYLKRSNHLERTKTRYDLIKTALGYDKAGPDEFHHRRFTQDNIKTMRRVKERYKVSAVLFGGDLQAYVNASRKDIPFVVERCVEYITLYGLCSQGIFRLPGSHQEIQGMQKDFEQGRDVLYDLGPTGDINNVASLLKSYFRMLPHPLFPVTMFDRFIECTRVKQGQERIPELAQLIEELPRPTMVVMRYLFQFLKTLSQHSDETSMDTRNLATCFGPTVMRSNTALDELTYAQNINEVIETVILFQEDIFPKADPGETEYSFIAITEGKDVSLNDIDEEKTDLNGTANSDFESTDSGHLSFKKGDELILHKQAEGNMWEASLGDQKGLVKDSCMDYEEREDEERGMKTPVFLSPARVSPLDRNNSTQRLVNDIDSTMQSALSSLDELSDLPPSSTRQQDYQDHQQPPPDLLRDAVREPSPLSRSRPSSVGSISVSSLRSPKGPPPMIKPKPKRPIRPPPNASSSTFKPSPGFSIKTKTL